MYIRIFICLGSLVVGYRAMSWRSTAHPAAGVAGNLSHSGHSSDSERRDACSSAFFFHHTLCELTAHVVEEVLTVSNMACRAFM